MINTDPWQFVCIPPCLKVFLGPVKLIEVLISNPNKRINVIYSHFNI
jgi:hypothetical protein